MPPSRLTKSHQAGLIDRLLPQTSISLNRESPNKRSVGSDSLSASARMFLRCVYLENIDISATPLFRTHLCERYRQHPLVYLQPRAERVCAAHSRVSQVLLQVKYARRVSSPATQTGGTTLLTAVPCGREESSKQCFQHLQHFSTTPPALSSNQQIKRRQRQAAAASSSSSIHSPVQLNPPMQGFFYSIAAKPMLSTSSQRCIPLLHQISTEAGRFPATDRCWRGAPQTDAHRQPLVSHTTSRSPKRARGMNTKESSPKSSSASLVAISPTRLYMPRSTRSACHQGTFSSKTVKVAEGC